MVREQWYRKGQREKWLLRTSCNPLLAHSVICYHTWYHTGTWPTLWKSPNASNTSYSRIVGFARICSGSYIHGIAEQSYNPSRQPILSGSMSQALGAAVQSAIRCNGFRCNGHNHCSAVISRLRSGDSSSNLESVIITASLLQQHCSCVCPHNRVSQRPITDAPPVVLLCTQPHCIQNTTMLSHKITSASCLQQAPINPSLPLQTLRERLIHNKSDYMSVCWRKMLLATLQGR